MAVNDIEAAFLGAVANISEIRATHDVEPLRLDLLPAVSLQFIGCPQEPSSTGWNVVTYLWRVCITLPNNDVREMQNTLKAILPQVIAVTRHDPSLNATCDWADCNDRQEDPFLVSEGDPARVVGYRKNLYLTAQITES